MYANVCILNGKLDNIVPPNVTRLHLSSFSESTLAPIDCVFDTIIVINEEMISPSSTKNPEISPENKDIITKNDTIINGMIR
jgi:hypothetical protein